MLNRLKCLTFSLIVFSLTSSMAVAKQEVVEHMAQAATSTDSKALADKLFSEGIQQYRLGKYPQALQTYEKALQIRRQLGDKAGIGQTLNNIGEVYLGLELDEKALQVLQPAFPNQPAKLTPKQANFAHPYYWAPFILIGNGL